MSATMGIHAGTYRVIFDRGGELDLYDVVEGVPVVATTSHEESPSDVTEQLSEINPGNLVKATLVETGEERDVGMFISEIHRFEDVEVVEETRAYHEMEGIPIVSKADKMIDSLTGSNPGISRANITTDGETIGHIVVFKQGHPDPSNPVFEEELSRLSNHGEPPFSVYQTATPDGSFFVHYYLVDEENSLAEELNEKLETV